MKRIFSYIISIAALLSTTVMQQSCTHHKLVVEDEIMMGALSVSTKALVNNKQELITQAWNNGENSTGFGVFGYKKKSDFTRLFNNVEVKPTSGSENTTWSYSPLRYWDSDPVVSYQFIAYWPHMTAEDPGDGSVYVSESNRVLTIHNIPNWQDATVGADIMTSARTGQYRSSTGDALFGNGMVPFTFTHRLALVGFTGFYIGIEDIKVKITNITLRKNTSDILSANGKVSYTEPFGGQDGSTGFSAPVKAADNVVLYNNPTGVVLDSDQFLDETQPGDSYTPAEICTWLSVPSDGWDNVFVDVHYSIGDGSTQTSTLNLSLDDGQTVGGYSYIFKLKFDTAGGGIIVETIFVKDWSNPIEVSKPVYNW